MSDQRNIDLFGLVTRGLYGHFSFTNNASATEFVYGGTFDMRNDDSSAICTNDDSALLSRLYCIQDYDFDEVSKQVVAAMKV
jgi:hypothetical protein